MRVRTGRRSRLNRPAIPETQQAFAVGKVGFIVYDRRGGCPAPEVVTNPPLGTPIKARRVEVFDPLGDQEADDHRLAPESEWVVNALSASNGGADDNRALAGHIVARSLNAATGHRYDGDTETLIVEGDSAARTPDFPRLRARCGRAGEAAFIAHTLRAEGHDASEDGTGRGVPLVAPSVVSNGDAHSGFRDERWIVAFSVNQRREGRLSEIHGSLHEPSGTQVDGVLSPDSSDIITEGGGDAETQEVDAGEVLRAVRNEVGEEAFAWWTAGILASFRSEEVLRPEVHGDGIHGAKEDGRSELDDSSLPRSECLPAGALRKVWRAGRERRAPQEWRLAGRLAGELGAYLSKLPYQGTPPVSLLRSLWRASQGSRILRQALSEIQEMGEPPGDEGEPALAAIPRRLTPREAERLQGFPDDWTRYDSVGAEIADSPRYRMLGNAVTVNVAEWIGRRIVRAATG